MLILQGSICAGKTLKSADRDPQDREGKCRFGKKFLRY